MGFCPSLAAVTESRHLQWSVKRAALLQVPGQEEQAAIERLAQSPLKAVDSFQHDGRTHRDYGSGAHCQVRAVSVTS